MFEGFKPFGSATGDAKARAVDLDAGRWYQVKAYFSGRFRTILKLRGFFQGWPVLSGLGHLCDLVAPPWRRSLRVPRLLVALGALSAVALLLGCNDYNASLGATPTITSALSFISPAAKPAGSEGFSLQVNGSGFVTGATVTWNNGNQSTNLATAIISSTQLVATVPAAQVANAGLFSIGVTTPATGGTTNLGNNISNFLPFCVFSSSNPTCSATPAARNALTSAGTNFSPSISAGPRYVAFVAASADASTSGTAVSTGVDKIFLRDTCQGGPQGCTPQTILVSSGLNDSAPNGASRSPSISADGRFVAFASDATNLVPSDDNGAADIFLRDTCIGAPADSNCEPRTIRISVGAGGTEANGASASPSIGPDGRFVAFDSVATNLIESASSSTGVSAGAFLRDTCFGATGTCTPSTTTLAITAATPAQ